MRLAIACLFVGLMLVAGIARADEPKSAPAENLQQLDQQLADAFTAAHVPGASVAVIEDGVVVLTKAYGFADSMAQKRATPETVFRAGSISKSLVGISVMMLVEEGKLDLNAKLGDLAPEIVFDNPWEATDPVRLVHLMEHTTGFDDIGFHHYLLDGANMPLKQAIEAYGPYRSRWKPGTYVAYCNSAPVIAGYIVEKASGLSWAEFTRTRIFEPLGMTSAHWDRAPEIVDRLAKSYRANSVGEEPYVDIPGKPAGSLNITPTDLAKLAILLIGRGTANGVTLLKPESVMRIETPASSLASRSGLAYGYGLGNVAIARSKAVFHGHDGGIDGFLSMYMYQPEHGAGLVVMVNAPQDDALKAADAITDYLQRSWPAAPFSEVKPEPGQLDALAGFYQSSASRQQMLAPIDGLTDWTWVKNSNGDLLINGTVRKGVGPRVFQRIDRAAPSTVFVDSGDGPRMLTALSVSRRVSTNEIIAKAAFVVVCIIVALISLICLPVWLLWSWPAGHLRDLGGIVVRLLPTLAVFSIVAVASILAYCLADGSSETLHVLGTPSRAARAIYWLSLSIPLFGVIAILAAFTANRDTPAKVRFLALLSGSLALVATWYLWPFGWIGLQTWA
jgi:CubicO group peptidase (beta-lactamase class C family)